MNVGKMSNAGAVTTINEIADGLKEFVKANPDNAKALLEVIAPALDDLDEDDFFGTEGWLHTFGIE